MTNGDRIRRFLRNGALTALKTSGAFHLVRGSDWRRQRLLILCYHGIALDDEYQWNPALYLRPEQLERRLAILRKGRYTVLPLAEALERLYRKDLPPCSAAITFDDGTYDFYRQAYQRLREFEFPVTVYLSTYYTAFPFPVFSLICSYMLWKARDRGTVDLKEFGVTASVSLAAPEQRQQALNELLQWTDLQDLQTAERNNIAAHLAERLKIDYRELVSKRILQLMNPQEVAELAAAGVDFQLHTHRHRTPPDETLFRKEIRDNRERIAAAVSGDRKHFCYPSGAYRPEFLRWLAAEDIVSATTCDTGLATPESNPLLLPRLVDTTGRTDLEFESWVNGIGHFLSSGKRAKLAHPGD
jgi:peptidoglycan/xylan/chitin deacetylase (PgdA/CDA1 family)